MTEHEQLLTDAATAKAVSTVSYAGAGTSIVSSLTLTDWGIIVGIITALATFALNVWFQWDRRRREVKEHELRIKELQDDQP